jgi:hypothetical protein
VEESRTSLSTQQLKQLEKGQEQLEKEQQEKEKEEGQEKEEAIFWEEFEWTPQEKSHVEEILSKHYVKSSIHANHITGRGDFLVDQLGREAHVHWDKFYKSVSE